MNEFVIDSFAMMTFLQKEGGYGRVEALLKKAKSNEVRLHIAAMSLAEVQYYVIRRGKDVSRILAALEALPLKVASADNYLPNAVAMRAKHGMAMPSCFAAALAQDLQCPLLTGDRDFRKLGTSINVEWLR